MRPVCSWLSVGFSSGAEFLTSAPSPRLSCRSLKPPIHLELELRDLLCWVWEPPRAKAPPKQSEEFEANKAPLPALSKNDGNRKAVPRGGAVQLADEAEVF